tara:strand:- start:1179 stop:1505 length:327 start_codon:yes stop_codon:yes gene_type:complete
LAAVASLAPESSSRNENTSLPDATQQALRKVVYQGSKKLTSEEIRISMKLFEWDASVFHSMAPPPMHRNMIDQGEVPKILWKLPLNWKYRKLDLNFLTNTLDQPAQRA